MDLKSIVGGLVGASASPVTGMLTGAKIALSALPTIFNAAEGVMAHLPDIKAKFADLVAKLEKAYDDTKHLNLASAKADLGAAWADGMAIYDDVGLPRALVQQVVATAAQDNKSAGFAAAAEDVAKLLAKQLGLPVLGSA